ncbi:MAG: glutamate formimidoyltransferase [Armatimonadota bacterium]
MQPIIQCVPNFSEGHNPDIVESIISAAKDASTVKIIDYSSDVDHNRMVLTLLGNPDEIYYSMIAAASRAVESIDMRRHAGAHPRIGAVDVVPLVPIRDISMQDCVALSYKIGIEIADKLCIPVYYYEQSAMVDSHVKLPDIRKGGFESLVGIDLDGCRRPDAGPNHIHPSAGAVVIGARSPLIAYNINLASDNIETARYVIKQIRMNKDILPGLKSISVHLKSRSLVQVSMNITEPDLLSVRSIYDFVKKAALQVNTDIVESEFIGAISNKYLADTSVVYLQAKDFRESQIIENWL